MIDLEELFPQWKDARILFTAWINGIVGWDVSIVGSSTGIGLKCDPPDAKLRAYVHDGDLLRIDTMYWGVMSPFVEPVRPKIDRAAIFPSLIREAENELIRVETELTMTDGKGVKYRLAEAFGVSPVKYLWKRIGER